MSGRPQHGELAEAVAAAAREPSGFVRVPRAFLQRVAPLLTGAELRCALALYAEIVGWDRESDKVSLKRIAAVTGLARCTVMRALRSLQAIGAATCRPTRDAAGDRGPSCRALAILPPRVGAATPLPRSATVPTVGAPTPLQVGAPARPSTEADRSSYTEGTPPTPPGGDSAKDAEVGFALAPPGERGNSRKVTDHEISGWFVEEFWPAYPRKVAKAAGMRAALKLRTPELRAAALVGLKRQLPRLQSRMAEDPSKVPHAATWLHGRRWEDEPETGPVRAAMMAGPNREQDIDRKFRERMERHAVQW